MNSERFANRYERLDSRNRDSWYMNDANRPFTVIQSIHSAGQARVRPELTEDPDFQKQLNRAATTIVEQQEIGGRFKLGGNMSNVTRPDGTVPYGPKIMTDQERSGDAVDNMLEHFKQIDVDPANVRVLFPDRDYLHGLSVVNVDEDTGVYEGGAPVRLQKQGDFLYTYNPEIVFAVRPADCPIAVISAETPKGQITMMIHFAWRGPAMGEYDDMQRTFDELGVDYSTMKVYITAGGHSETFRYDGQYKPDNENNPAPTDERLFKDVVAHGDPKNPTYTFAIDTVKDVYEAFRSDLELDDDQIFVDTTDTTAPESGTASNSRAVNYEDDNVRDIVTVQIERQPSKIASNPDNPTPPEIEWQIIPLEVDYIDFEGSQQTSVIEINRAAYDDVKAFFAKALEIGYPIEKLVKSSDPEYAWNDSKLLADNASSGFNYRLIAGTNKVSKHGSGYAFDINTYINPYIRYKDGEVIVDPPDAVYDPNAKGALTTDHPLVVLMKERGWNWGGDWTPESGRTDYQHFDKILPND